MSAETALLPPSFRTDEAEKEVSFARRDLRRNRYERLARGGDVIVSLGAGWGIPGYMKHIAEVKRRCGIKFAIFVHDVIPIKHQSFVEPHHAALFRAWLRDAVPVADIVLTNSKYSRGCSDRAGCAVRLAIAARRGRGLGRSADDRRPNND